MFSIEVGPQMLSSSTAQETSWSSAVLGLLQLEYYKEEDEFQNPRPISKLQLHSSRDLQDVPSCNSRLSTLPYISHTSCRLLSPKHNPLHIISLFTNICQFPIPYQRPLYTCPRLSWKAPLQASHANHSSTFTPTSYSASVTLLPFGLYCTSWELSF